MDNKQCCGTCVNWCRISKQFGLCIPTNKQILNVNIKQYNNVYYRTGKYNYCDNYKANETN